MYFVVQMLCVMTWRKRRKEWRWICSVQRDGVCSCEQIRVVVSWLLIGGNPGEVDLKFQVTFEGSWWMLWGVRSDWEMGESDVVLFLHGVMVHEYEGGPELQAGIKKCSGKSELAVNFHRQNMHSWGCWTYDWKCALQLISQGACKYTSMMCD